MILHPDGKVEGTPEEIAQWKKTQEQRFVGGHFKKLTNVKGRCPNEGRACFCTGECLI